MLVATHSALLSSCSSSMSAAFSNVYVWSQDFAWVDALCPLFGRLLITLGPLSALPSILGILLYDLHPRFPYVFEVAFDGAQRRLEVSQGYTQARCYPPSLIGLETTQTLLFLALLNSNSGTAPAQGSHRFKSSCACRVFLNQASYAFPGLFDLCYNHAGIFRAFASLSGFCMCPREDISIAIARGSMSSKIEGSQNLLVLIVS